MNLVKLLIANGADPVQQDNKGHNASWYAKQAGNAEIEKYLNVIIGHRSSEKNEEALLKSNPLLLLKWFSKFTNSSPINQPNDKAYWL